MVYIAPAKVNIFLKIVGRREDGYHLISSRFVLHEALNDVMWFEKAGVDGFSVVGDFECELQHNTIYKAYEALKSLHPSRNLKSFAELHKVMVYKSIPSGAGLGGGSSNAATFLKMINKEADLKLTTEQLMEVGLKVGADVPFFVSGYKSANVSGIGEIIEPFDEPLPILEVKTPPISCHTATVYRKFRQNFADTMPHNQKMAGELLTMRSSEIVANYKPAQLNDLFAPALKSYPELLEFKEDGWYFSGSGSSFFRVLK